jgi:hypothetical protein
MIFIYIILLLLVLFYIFTKLQVPILKKEYKIKHLINSAPNFILDDFKKECGDEIIDIGDFLKDGNPYFYPTKVEKIKLSEWFDNDQINKNLENRQSRVSFFLNTENKITLYILNWLYNNKNKFPYKIQELLNNNNNNNNNKFTLRISKGKWDFPSHFDPNDNFMIILSGDRNVILNHNLKLLLNKNDILFFGEGIEHHFWCDNNKLNIILNITFKNKNSDGIFNKKFKDSYPEQIERLDNLVDFIDYN